jgi:hypothetical protein
MTAFVQVIPCSDHGDYVERTATERADFFGVYLCDPLASWVADFESAMHAVTFAEALAESKGLTLQNFVGS